MAWKCSILVVANITATSEALVAALKARAERGPVAVTLIVPATRFGGSRAAAREQLRVALEQLTAAGLQVDGRVGDADPIVAVTESWDPRRFDEIIVSTLPAGISKWLHTGLPERIGKLTGASVTHVVSQPPKPALQTVAPPVHENYGILSPFAGLGLGHKSR